MLSKNIKLKIKKIRKKINKLQLRFTRNHLNLKMRKI